MCLNILYQVQIFHPIPVSRIPNSRLASPCHFSVHLLLFNSLILLTHCTAVVVPQIFPVVPWWLFLLIRHPFTSYRHPFLRPFLAYSSSFFAATSLFFSPALLQPALLPPFTHIYRTWQDAENSNSKRNWWHVLGFGSGHKLQKKKHFQIGGGEFRSMRMSTRITWGGRKKNHKFLVFQKGSISGSLSHVKCIYANICYKPDMSPCSGNTGLVPWYFSTHQGI